MKTKPDIWYVETLGFDGKYRQQKFHGDKPVEKSPDGKRRRFRFEPQKIPNSARNATWSSLRVIMVPSGVSILV